MYQKKSGYNLIRCTFSKIIKLYIGHNRSQAVNTSLIIVPLKQKVTAKN